MDLIERQAAIERATKEHDFFRGAVTVSDKARRDELLDVMCWLGELPSAQPEIIRCKDCKYAHITYGGEVKYCDIWFPNESHYIDTDNYCSFAERRTDG